MGNFIAKSIRLIRYLYSLEFKKESIVVDDSEMWKFKKDERLQEALTFYFNFRKHQ